MIVRDRAFVEGWPAEPVEMERKDHPDELRKVVIRLRAIMCVEFDISHPLPHVFVTIATGADAINLKRAKGPLQLPMNLTVVP
jgi:hypothetical protein